MKIVIINTNNRISRRVFTYSLLLLYTLCYSSCSNSHNDSSDSTQHIKIRIGEYWLTVADRNVGIENNTIASFDSHGDLLPWGIDNGNISKESRASCNNFLDGKWRLPNKAELEVIGQKLTQFNGGAPILINEEQNNTNFVYFPFAGYKLNYNDKTVHKQLLEGVYWSSELEANGNAKIIYFNKFGITNTPLYNNENGFSVRCVKGGSESEPDLENMIEIEIEVDNYRITVADRNAGVPPDITASHTSYGNYYAWSKNDNSNNTTVGIGAEEAGGACQNFSKTDKTWRLPNKRELEVIAEKLVVFDNNSKILKNEKSGATNFVFFPLAGYKEYYIDTEIKSIGNTGHYWSSESTKGKNAWQMNFSTNGKGQLIEGYRTYGYSVRCVKGDNQ